MPDALTSDLQGWISRINSGDKEAQKELLTHTRERFMRMARRMLHGSYSRVEKFEQTDDIVQELYVRVLEDWDGFLKTKNGVLDSVAEYFSHAAQVMSHTLVDLARKHYGRSGNRPKKHSIDNDEAIGKRAFEPSTDTYNPESLAVLTEFHETVAQLPDNLKKVVYLHWFNELTHQETALCMGIGESTVRQHWVNARLRLHPVFAKHDIDEGFFK